MNQRFGRYRLIDLVSRDPGSAADGGAQATRDVELWHGHDDVLGRDVSMRIIELEDPRCAATIGAAQAAALVDDRRLLRVLDVLSVGSTASEPAVVAVISEWVGGRNLERSIEDRAGTPYAPSEALALVKEVAGAVNAGTNANVTHGRLRPSSVFITDAGEIRVRGLAVDAALFGQLPAGVDREQADVDALGSLLYLLTTGYWPGSGHVNSPPAPQSNGFVLPPSQVRASVPRGIDDVTARSVMNAARQRGVARVSSVAAFTTMIGAALDHVAPVATRRADSAAPRPSAVRTMGRWTRRLLAVVVALALALALGWVGWQMTTGSTQRSQADAAADTSILTTAAKPIEDPATVPIDQALPISSYRSYDPFGDDNGDGKPDKRKGLENEADVVKVNDTDPQTAWLTDEYDTPTLDGKAGVGLIVDLGQSRDIQQVTLRLIGKGSDVDVRVANKILPDPALWTELAGATRAGNRIDVRAPRPVTGRYVLLWFTRVPPTEDTWKDTFQGGVKSIVVSS